MAVVGPSGAGKDSLIEAARKALEGDTRFVFARRVITRPSSSTEDNISVTEAEFHERVEKGEFLLHWGAHGLYYGIPMTYRWPLEQGKHVIANLSRTSLIEAERCYAGVTVAHIDASPSLRAARIAARARETTDDVLVRLTREAPLHVKRSPIVEIRNDGSFEEARDRFISMLRDL